MRFLETAQSCTVLVEGVADPVISAADLIGEHLQNRRDQTSQSPYHRIIDFMQVPIIMKTLEDAKTWQERLRYTAQVLNMVSQMLKVGSSLWWGSIGLAGLWLILDLIFGKAKRLVFVLLFCALAVNLFAYIYLQSLLANAFPIF